MKKRFIRLLIIIIILIIPVLNLISFASQEVYVETANETNLSFIEKLDKLSLTNVKKRIDKLIEEKRIEEEAKKKEEERLQRYQNFITDISEGKITFRQLFSDVLIVGDSLMHGLATSRILDSSNMITMVSASLFHLEENIYKIIANNPGKLVLHYGINMLESNEEQLEWFIEMYEEIIIELKESLTDTEIYISGIFNVEENVQPKYPWIEKYNAQLIKLCKKLDVIYIDNSDILPGDDSYYGSDGIHVAKNFYSEVWLPYLYFSIMK